MPSPVLIERPPADDDELWEFIATFFGFRFPRVAVCPGHVAPFTAIADAYFARSPVTIWKASRGFGGKTRALGILGLAEAVSLGAGVTILGGSGGQSVNVHEAQEDAWRHPLAPRALLERERTIRDTVLRNDGWIKALMASQTSVRGPHPHRLRLDEIDDMDMAIAEAAQGQPMRGRQDIATQTVMSGTHQHPDATMTAMLRRAAERGWPVHEWCWRENLVGNSEHGWLTLAEVEQKRGEVSEAMWCLPAGEPVATDRGDVPIEQVTSSDQVWTRRGWRRVVAAGWSGVKPVVRVAMVDGRWVDCTPDHRIALADGGWCEAGDLRPGDAVASAVPPHRFPATSPTGPVAVRPHIDVLVGPRVTVDALGPVSEAVSDGVANVLGAGHQQQVVRVDAVDPVAVVLHGHPVGDRTVPRLERDAVGEDLVGDLQPAGPVAVAHGRPVPSPASVVVDVGPAPDVAAQVGHARVGSSGVGARSTAGDATPGDDRSAVEAPGLVVAHVTTISGGEHVYDLTVDDVQEFAVRGVIVHNSAEYDLQEPNPEGRAIDPDAVEAAFDASLGEAEGGDGEYVEVEAPVPGGDYVTGVDWAKRRDWTVIRTFRVDVLPYREVAYMRVQRRPWPVLVGFVHERVERFGGAVAHDSIGIGDVVDDYLEVDAVGVELRGAKRQQAFTEYVSAIEQGDVVSPRVESCYNAHRYVLNDDLYGSGHPPDPFIAGAIALHHVRRRRVVPVVSPGGDSQTSGWRL